MITYGFTGRAEGDMRGHKAILDFLTHKYPRLRAIVRPRQVHHDNIEIISTVSKDERLVSIGDTDGVITGQKNIALTIITADCVPAVYYDERHGMIGASHQGWKGMFARLPQKMVVKMHNLGCSLGDIKVSVGPSINACCYEVHQDRAIMFRSQFPDSKAIIDKGSHFFLNLSQLCVEQLTEAGIPGQNIEYKINCTSCKTDNYYSYRKSQNKESFEEQLSYIVQW